MGSTSLLRISSNRKLKKKIKRKRWKRLKGEMMVRKWKKATCSWKVTRKIKSQ